ncbi:hypothetical protein PRZ48_000409 [Zasmidium cellare]|uniref:Uncharacterized protein n=1 Tax=Zasmidium cellare TaxID=395010 RepID=A0ABR0EZZ5_ZASCE|nr:hypothetical protein PRZ48_000409 [Zasmidium cellare]
MYQDQVDGVPNASENGRGGPNRSALFINYQQDSFALESSSAALQRAYNTRSTLSGRSERLYRLSSTRIRGIQRGLARYELRSSLPNDDALLSPRWTVLEPLYSSLLDEFQPDKQPYGGIFSADRAPTAEARHYSSIAICIRELLPWGAQRTPILDASIFSLLTLYYGRLHGDAGLVGMSRSSYATALSQYHGHLDRFSSGEALGEQARQRYIGASIALQYFEHLDKVEVFDAGHQAHVDGALKLLQLGGPELLQGSRAFRLTISSLKPVATYLAIHRRRPNLLSQTPWREESPDVEERTARNHLFQIGLDIPALLNTADNNISARTEGVMEQDRFVDLSLHLLLEFGHLWSRLEDWLHELTSNARSPLYWPRSQPHVVSTPRIDEECGPKDRDSNHQLSFAYGTYAGLLVQYWAFQLELLMTMIDLRQAVLAHSGSSYVRKMTFDTLAENKNMADGISQLIFEAQIYLESCLEGFICMQLPLKTVTKYFDRPHV